MATSHNNRQKGFCSLPLCPSTYLQLGLARAQLFSLGIPESTVHTEPNQTTALCKDQLKVKCVYFSPGNALGPPTSVHRMKFLWIERDICSLSAHNPAVDSSALAHLLFLRATLCVWVFVCLRAWQQMCVKCALFVLLNLDLRVIGLYEMEKAGLD